MLTAAVTSAASLLMILLSSALFTNGIEQMGQRLKMRQGEVGSIPAAIGTALPETIIPIVCTVIAYVVWR